MNKSTKLTKLVQNIKTLNTSKNSRKLILAVSIFALCLSLSKIRLIIQSVIHDDDNIQVIHIGQARDTPLPTFTVVTVENPTTIFHQDEFAHGFGYALLIQFVDQLSMQLDLRTVKDEATALKWVQLGKANMALSTASKTDIRASGLHTVLSSCSAPHIFERFGLNAQLSMVFDSSKVIFSNLAQEFVCKTQQSGATEHLAAFYAQNYLSHEDLTSFTRDLASKLPIYRDQFIQSANVHDLDWEFLLAIGYQESYLNPQAVSPTGVKGVMMLTQDTAKHLGVVDRNNTSQSIDGGAKYLQQLLKSYAHIPQPDRNWIALAAYNLGINHVNQIRAVLRKEGKDPDQWLSIYRYLQDKQHTQPRYQQVLHYVTRIRVYLEHIKTT